MKTKKIISNILYFVLIAIVCFFGIQVAATLLLTPIISFYSAAYNFYSIAGDASFFEVAKNASRQWLINVVLLCLSVLLFKIVDKKRSE